jgi:hypothetical protein
MTSSGCACGVGTSEIRTTSGGPYRVRTAAFMTEPYSDWWFA